MFARGLFVIVVCWGSAASAQPAASAQAPPPPRNLQVLKPQDVGPAMRSFTFALGVQCNYCHVMEPTRDMASDEKQAKKTARVMLQMVSHVNEMLATGVGKAAADVSKVQCATCHRGKAIPETPETPPPPPPAPR
ncbi:MAG TPA: c-type cytochrome [Vicinamibacterales bacterium]|nr:c-type cytochrome [Vicinamibacterales bacterium]